ncbi:hypothetical protein QJS83_04735 [Bdellovibrio sp. 22V]|uniref:hypothetical protein n=1 Tax=Bdellovibrio sp. 22V TaxID=3044166 RepID=UPI002542A1C3|nr:hypothetical protein [Bdellovibrio sp. 22V]WII73178.1 hypothetical protein QJS83_04735 [Bdellovibrio sp. 22V]
MMITAILMILFGFTHESKAADISIVDVRRNITMAEDDPVYKDFYINAGPTSGLKKNLVVTAVRKINIRDASGANAVGEILVPVGQLKIIAVYDRVAVAREFTLLSRDELPMLEQTGIMAGDRIELKGSFIDNSKPKPRKTASETALPAGTTTVVTTTTTTFVPLAAAAPIVPSPMSPPPVTVAPQAPVTVGPVDSAKVKADSLLSAPAGEILEKTADSGNNTPL